MDEPADHVNERESRHEAARRSASWESQKSDCLANHTPPPALMSFVCFA